MLKAIDSDAACVAFNHHVVGVKISSVLRVFAEPF